MRQPRDLQQGKWQSCAAGGGLAGTAEETLPFFLLLETFTSVWLLRETPFALKLWSVINNPKGLHQQTYQVQAP